MVRQSLKPLAGDCRARPSPGCLVGDVMAGLSSRSLVGDFRVRQPLGPLVGEQGKQADGRGWITALRGKLHFCCSA